MSAHSVLLDNEIAPAGGSGSSSSNGSSGRDASNGNGSLRYASTTSFSAAPSAYATGPKRPRGVVGHFRSLFPSPRTRLVFFVWALVLIVFLALWMASIVRSRWIAAIHDPATRLSMEWTAAIPSFALFAFQLDFLTATAPATEALGLAEINTIAPFRLVNIDMLRGYASPGASIPSAAIGPFLSCQESLTIPAHNLEIACASPWGRSFLPDFAADPTNTPAPPPGQSLDWQSTQDRLVFTMHLVLNASAMQARGIAPYEFNEPVLAAMQLSAADASGDATKQIDSNAPITPATPGSSLWAKHAGTSWPLVFNAAHLLTVSSSRKVFLSGASSWLQSVESSSALLMSPRAVADAWEELVASFASTDPQLAARLMQLKAQPDMQYYTLRSTYRPAAFLIPVTREYSAYGFWSFCSDLGGVAALLHIAFLLSFPMWTNGRKPIWPRIFVGEWVLKLAATTGSAASGPDSAAAGAGEAAEASSQKDQDATNDGDRWL